MRKEADICRGEMRTIDFDEAKTYQFQQMEQASRGEPSLIASSRHALSDASDFFGEVSGFRRIVIG